MVDQLRCLLPKLPYTYNDGFLIKGGVRLICNSYCRCLMKVLGDTVCGNRWEVVGPEEMKRNETRFHTGWCPLPNTFLIWYDYRQDKGLKNRRERRPPRCTGSTLVPLSPLEPTSTKPLSKTKRQFSLSWACREVGKKYWKDVWTLVVLFRFI